MCYFLTLCVIAELTDTKIQALSEEMDEATLLKLGTDGLGLRDSKIKKHISNYPKSISIAARNFFMEWARSKENRAIAYKEMESALRAAELAELIGVVLKK